MTLCRIAHRIFYPRRVISVIPPSYLLLHSIRAKSLSAFSTFPTRYMASAAPSNSRRQPPWTQQKSSSEAPALPPLKVYNSLTRTKVPFIPIDPAGRKVTWYCCGPTVYDAGHLGHARNYVTTDVLRRIMRDYFGFDVTFVQNVTDVDDKIILRARQNHLFGEYTKKNSTITPEVKATVLEAWNQYLNQNLTVPEGQVITPDNFLKWVSEDKDLSQLYAIVDKELKCKPGDQAEEILLNEKDTKKKMHLKTLLTSSNILVNAPQDAKQIYEAANSILPPYLDSKAKAEGREYGMEIFSKLSTYWENHFNEDMKRLNVLPPTIITRVSEFIPENVAFVQRLVEKGLAYPTQNGSVYFDIQAYEERGHHYAKLEPWNRGDASLIADGEGALSAAPTDTSTAPENPPPASSSNVFLKDKKSASDFALWKSSKSGEPSWPSPWGPGRPGWHIECSVMASHVLGGKIDIHSGGIDLAFPHHDNEIAQSEAYWDDGANNKSDCCGEHGGDGRHQWINYFLHMGHLSIQGSKMSKSLKNFVSIREALARGPSGEAPAWTARGLRVVFLMGGWKEGIEVGAGVLVEAKKWEETIGKFFVVIKALVAEETEKEQVGQFVPMKFTAAEAQIYKNLDEARVKLHAALCNNFNTPQAMDVLSDIIQKANIYMQGGSFSVAALKEIARWVTRIINIFGLDSTPYAGDKIGWSDASTEEATAANKEEILMPYLRILSSFRDQVRALALSKPEVLSKDLLALCDDLREEVLPPLGVSLDDRDITKALVKLVPPEVLLAAKAEKERKAAEKEANRLEREAAERKRLDAGKLNPVEMFKPPHSDEFRAWDDDGIPTHTKDGEPITKSRSKKVRKDWERQKKLHDAWKTANTGN